MQCSSEYYKWENSYDDNFKSFYLVIWLVAAISRDDQEPTE